MLLKLTMRWHRMNWDSVYEVKVNHFDGVYIHVDNYRVWNKDTRKWSKWIGGGAFTIREIKKMENRALTSKKKPVQSVNQTA